ncbi:bifunctional 5,10-methylenetetrahydrofolate dehydrogenase/5,10-methenyltetrahydrofolate cyclohydrolase [Haliangium sp.]|uniref:bifunctional 5,10-methylenetetrahydrofolate dehydrogenase/5,10-methenyltetrahydrofolate cyclohydrolase n=1 Tax=Haliangium sp. TaxID=2663208 RepID=UPI003D116D1F
MSAQAPPPAGARVLDGKALAAELRRGLAAETAALAGQGVIPGLAVVLVGEHPASVLYVRNKQRAAEAIGVRAQVLHLPAETSQAEVLARIDELNRNPEIDGVLIQLPLPEHIDAQTIQDAVEPSKDVDGLHVDNLGLLAQGRPRFVAATPRGCMRLIAASGVDPAGRRALVVGRSNLVGKPMAMALTNANATVTLAHSCTVDLAAEVARAEILVVAVGQAGLIRGEWIRPGAVVIDVGINRDPTGALVGDVAFAPAAARAAAITPVPGGVGPMTIASLLENTVLAASRRADR